MVNTAKRSVQRPNTSDGPSLNTIGAHSVATARSPTAVVGRMAAAAAAPTPRNVGSRIGNVQAPAPNVINALLKADAHELAFLKEQQKQDLALLKIVSGILAQRGSGC